MASDTSNKSKKRKARSAPAGAARASASVLVTLRVDADLLARFDDLAARSGATRSALFRWLMARALSSAAGQGDLFGPGRSENL